MVALCSLSCSRLEVGLCAPSFLGGLQQDKKQIQKGSPFLACVLQKPKGVIVGGKELSTKAERERGEIA